MVKTFATFGKNFQLSRLCRLSEKHSTFSTLATFEQLSTFTRLSTFEQLSTFNRLSRAGKVTKYRHFSFEKWRFCQYLGIFPAGRRVIPGAPAYVRAYGYGDKIIIYARKTRKNGAKINFNAAAVLFTAGAFIARFWAK